MDEGGVLLKCYFFSLFYFWTGFGVGVSHGIGTMKRDTLYEKIFSRVIYIRKETCGKEYI